MRGQPAKQRPVQQSLAGVGRGPGEGYHHQINVYLPRVQAGGLSNRTEAALHPQAILNGKETIMRKRIILFVLPVIALLIMGTALVLSTAASSFAKGPTHTHTTSAPAKPSHGITPNFSWYN